MKFRGQQCKILKEKCFHCDVQGQWKHNCPKYLAELDEKKHQNGKSELHILESLLVEVDTSSWIIYSGATNHICSSLQLLESFRELAKGVVTMRVGYVASILVKAIGKAHFQYGIRFLDLENIYFIPNFSRNFISVSILA